MTKKTDCYCVAIIITFFIPRGVCDNIFRFFGFMFSAHIAKNVISCTPHVSKLVNFHEQ